MNSVTRRKPFSKREDETLKKLVHELGASDWSKVAKRMAHRTAKQCRDRYNNYLSSDFKIGLWTEQETERLKSLVDRLGPKWVEISKMMSNRSPNDLKNRWYKHIIRKKLRGDEVIPSEILPHEDALNLADFDEEQIITMFSISDPLLDEPESNDKM